MSEYDGEVIKLLTQILDELRRIRISLDERDRIQQEENEDLLKRIEVPMFTISRPLSRFLKNSKSTLTITAINATTQSTTDLFFVISITRVADLLPPHGVGRIQGNRSLRLSISFPGGASLGAWRCLPLCV